MHQNDTDYDLSVYSDAFARFVQCNRYENREFGLDLNKPGDECAEHLLQTGDFLDYISCSFVRWRFYIRNG